MGDFSQFNNITRINEILHCVNYTTDTINLSNNAIKKGKINLLPDNVLNVNLNYNIIDSIIWDDRKWGTLSFEYNNIDVNEFEELECETLILDNNSIDNITFINCKIKNLSLSNNKIENINFFDTYIETLNLSKNHMTKIITLPNSLKKLILDNNKIKEINIMLSDEIEHLNLSHNKLKNILNIPQKIKYLDLSKNKLNFINVNLLPSTLEYLDISCNKIPNNTELFENVKNSVDKLFYDTDVENNDESDNDSSTTTSKLSESSESSEFSKLSKVSELSEVKLNYKNLIQNTNNFREIKIDDDDGDEFSMDDEIANAINEYEDELNEKKNENDIMNDNFWNCDMDLNDLNSNEYKMNNKKYSGQSNYLHNLTNKKNLMSMTTMEKYRNYSNNGINLSDARNMLKENVYLPLVPVELKWNINLN